MEEIKATGSGAIPKGASVDGEATINDASDTLTAALCAMNSIENAIVDESLGKETVSAFYGIRSIIRNCRNGLVRFGDGK